MIIKIKNEEYQYCVEKSEEYWCNKKTGFFGRGIINTKKDKYKVTRIGLFGEMALAKYLGITPDFKFIHCGDQFDFIINGKTIDVKTASRNYGASLIRCRSEKGRSVFKPKDIYVAALLEEENSDKLFCRISLKGWETLDFVRKLPEVPAMVGKHLNYELKFDQLRGIGTLKKFLWNSTTS